MSTDDRQWTAIGTTVTGTAPGRPDLAWAPVFGPNMTGSLDDLERAAELLAYVLNADGEPQLTDNERRVLNCVIHHQGNFEWHCPISKVVADTGLPRQTVSKIFDRLVAKGLGTRPPRNVPDQPVQHRPFVAHKEGVKR